MNFKSPIFKFNNFNVLKEKEFKDKPTYALNMFLNDNLAKYIMKLGIIPFYFKECIKV